MADTEQGKSHEVIARIDAVVSKETEIKAFKEPHLTTKNDLGAIFLDASICQRIVALATINDERMLITTLSTPHPPEITASLAPSILRFLLSP